MSVQEDAAQALAERNAAIEKYAELADLQAMDALRWKLAQQPTQPGELALLDAAILDRKRQLKAKAEGELAVADWVEKSTLPVVAASPAFIGLLFSEGMLPSAHKSAILAGTAIFAALVWVALRFAAVYLAFPARRALAKLGKVD